MNWYDPIYPELIIMIIVSALMISGTIGGSSWDAGGAVGVFIVYLLIIGTWIGYFLFYLIPFYYHFFGN
jgi:hypothetical protein